jgi:hypothetical protein
MPAATLKIKNGDAITTPRGIVEMSGNTVCLYETSADLVRILLKAFVLGPGEQVRYDKETGAHVVEF